MVGIGGVHLVVSCEWGREDRKSVLRADADDK